MMEGDDCSYQCKLCDGKFKTTADLQKHKRLSHRDSTKSVTAVTNAVKPKKPVSPPKTNATTKPVMTVIDSNSEPGTRRRGTRYSKTRSSSGRKGHETSLGQSHLSCASCSHNFDTKDPVVSHLLRQSMNENGSHKCPFCATILLETSNSLSTPASSKSGYRSQQQTTFAETSKATDRSSRYARRTSQSSTGNEETTAKHLSIETSSSNPADIPTLQKSKRKSSLPSKTSTPARKKMTKDFVGQNANALSNSTKALTISPAFVMEGTTALASPKATTPFVPLQSAFQRQIEVTYTRQARGKGSRGGIGSRRRASGLDRRSNELVEDHSQNSAEAPLKVSVLINNNPVPSATRLAVPKGKHFQKGNIRCPYCDLVAKSVREVQFHVNTHLPKSYPCEFCTHIYRSKQAVKNHTEKYHPNEVSQIKAFSDDSNQSQEDSKEIENDRRSMSNYSFSFVSESYSNEDSQSQDSNIENNDSFSFTVADSSYCDFQTRNERVCQDQAYYSSTANALLHEQHQDLFSGGRVGGGPVEKVLELANF